MSKAKKTGKTSRRASVHTMPNPDGPGWIIRLDRVILSPWPERKTAEQAGRWWARHCRAEHTIYGKDGRILEKNSYWKDPHPLRDET